MGIATTLVRAWEDGTNQPDTQQIETLAKILRFDATHKDYFKEDSIKAAKS
jgi:ribosome-binding protein aMBF1 (putative translation factor)